MKKLTDPVLLVGSPASTPDLRYATGFTSVDPVVYLQVRNRGYLVVPAMELGRARRHVHAHVQVLTPAHLHISRAQRRRLSAWALGLLNLVGKRCVVVPAAFPLGVAQRMQKGGVRVRVARQPVFPARAVKSRVELARLREAQRAAAAAMRAAVRTIAKARCVRGHLATARGKPLTADDIRRVVDAELLARNCIARETIVACGRQAADPHELGQGVLRSGQPIVLDIFPQHRVHGYWGDISRTVVRGKASAEVKRMFGAVRAAQRSALARVRAGAPVAAVHRSAQREFERRGFVTHVQGGVAEGFIHGTGHGVGLDIHEAPSLAAGPGRLKAGEVVTIEPGLYYRRTGGVRIEDLVVVTKTGWRYLGTAGIRLEV